MTIRFKFIFLLLISASTVGFGQTVRSPYTIQGIGDIQVPALVPNRGMGDLGLSYGSFWHLNNQNPALLVNNGFTTFSMGGVADSRTTSTNTAQQQNTTGTLDYIALGIPVQSGKWSMSFGVNAYSTVDYNIVTLDTTTIQDSNLRTTFLGEGGLNQLFIASGHRITKELSVGVKASYLFGPIEKETIITVDNTTDIDPADVTAFVDRVTYSDVTVGFGLSYRKEIKEKLRLNAGLVYDLQTKLTGEEFKRIESRIIENDPTPIVSDTLAFEQSGSITLPQRLGFGISMDKENKWMIGMDLAIQNWEDYESFDKSAHNLENSYKFAVGGYFIPDIASVKSYLKRMTYRAGFSYEATPYSLNNEQINEMGFTAGFSFPVKGLSTVDLAVKYGIRGKTENNLIREEYFKIYLGVSFNDAPWKKRPIYN